MADTELNEKIKVEGVEQAESKLNRLWQATARVAAGFGGITTMVSGLFGVWKVTEAVHDLDEMYGAINRVRAMTGVTADKAYGLFKAFELSGVQIEGAERVMISMARLSGKLGEGVAESAEQAQHLQMIMKKVGVGVKSGPTDRLLEMSAAVKKGKLDVNDMMLAFSLPKSQAGRMMAMLQQGPERLKDIMKEAMGSSAVIDDAALASYAKMIQARRELADAWKDVVGVLYKSVMPALTVILHGVKGAFEEIQPIVDRIGATLTKHMEVIVKLAKTYAVLMLANKGIGMATGTTMGVGARGKSLFSGAMGRMTSKAAAAGGADYFAAKAASPGIGMFASSGGPLVSMMSSVAGKLGIIGAVVAVVIAAFHLLANNVWGIRDRLAATFGSIFGHLKEIFGKLVSVLAGLWKAVEPLVGIFGGVLLFALDAFATMLDGILRGIIAIINGVIWLLNKIPMVDIDKIDMDKLKDEDKKTPDSTEKSQVYQDFRGSKFEISNNFPQNVDGARVAVSFGDQLAKMGERRIDAGVRPLYSYR